MTDRNPDCCGACPPIEGGGYDCTCKGNPHCPKSTRLSVAWANLKNALLAPFEEIHHKIIMRNWKRKRRKRKYQGLGGGQDD